MDISKLSLTCSLYVLPFCKGCTTLASWPMFPSSGLSSWGEERRKRKKPEDNKIRHTFRKIEFTESRFLSTACILASSTPYKSTSMYSSFPWTNCMRMIERLLGYLHEIYLRNVQVCPLQQPALHSLLPGQSLH